MSEGLWIAIAVIAVLIVAALVVGLVRYRRSRISLPPGRDETTAVDRSGGYAASSGITFSRTEDLAPTVGEDAEVPRDAESGSLNFEPESMRRLFKLGEENAMAGKAWARPD